MSPIADYDLGKAHGKVVIDYDDKGSKQAQSDMQKMEGFAQRLISVFSGLHRSVTANSRDFGDVGAKMARTFAIISGGTAIMLGLSQATGSFTGRLFQLRGGMAILGAIGTLFGGLPRTVSGFPNIIKQIILLSSAITLFSGSAGLLNSVFVQLGKFAASTKIFQTLTALFPQFTSAIAGLAKHIPSIRQVGEGVDRIGAPIHRIARMALGLGALIATIRSGVSIAFALATGMAKIGAAALGIQIAVKAAAFLISALKELSGLIGLLPGALAIAGIGFAAVKLGMIGFSDAMKNLDDVDKFNEALKKMGPNAQDAAKAIRDLKPGFDGVRKAIQDQLFQDLAGPIRNLGNIYLPVLRDGLGGVARAINGAVREFAGFLAFPRTVAGINELFNLTAFFIQNVTRVIQPFLSAFLDIAIVSAEVLTEMTQGIGNAAESFRDFIAAAREDGSLKAWIENGVQALRDLLATFFQIGQIVGIIFRAFGVEGGNALSTANQLTGALRDFLKSAEGQEALKNLVSLIQLFANFTGGVLSAALQALGPILLALKPFVEQLAGAFGASLILVIQALTPILVEFAKILSTLAPIITPILGAFLAMGVAGKVLVLIVGPLVTGLNLLVSAFAIFRGAISAVITIWKILQFVFAVSPWTIIIAAIVLLVILIITNWDTIKEALAVAWEWIKSTAITVWTAISDFFVGIWNWIKQTAIDVWNSIKQFFIDYWPFILGIFTGGIGLVVGLIIQNWDAIKQFTMDIWNTVVDFLVGIWDSVWGFVKDIFTNIVDFITGVWNTVKDATKFIWEPILSIISSIIHIIYDIIRTFFNLILIAVIHAWNTLRDATLLVWETISTATMTVWQAIVDFFTFIFEWIVALFHQFFDPIVQWWTDFWTTATTIATTLWNEFTAWLQEKFDLAIKTWHMMFDPIIEWWQGFWNDITTGASEALDAIVKWIQEKFDLAIKVWHTMFDPIIDWFSGVWNSVKDTVSDGVNWIVDWMQSIPTKISNALGDLGNLLLNAGKAVIEGFLNGLKNAFKNVEDFVNGIANWVSSHKGPLPVDRVLLVPAGVAIMQGLLNGLVSKRETIIGFLEGLTGDIAGGINVAGKKIANASSALSTSTNVGIISTAASVVTNPATGLGPGLAPATPVLAASAAGSASSITIDKVEIPINAHLDPTDAMEWKKAMGAITDGIRDWERERS